MAEDKLRLDKLVQSRHPELSRSTIVNLIKQGLVSVDGQVLGRPGALVHPACELIVDLRLSKYVSRAGFKLEYALKHFEVKVNNLIALDAGISTGGFTDCLLQHGVARVYGVDVGHGQTSPKILTDSRVVIFEKINLRTFSSLPELVDLVTLDLSFISVLKVIKNVSQLMKPEAMLLVLVKPQFELEQTLIGSGGIVRKAELRELAIKKVVSGVTAEYFTCMGVYELPILGGDGNQEFMAYFLKQKKGKDAN